MRSKEVYKLSRFVYFYRKEHERKVLFNALNLEIFYIDSEALKYIHSYKTPRNLDDKYLELNDTLKKNKMIVREEDPESLPSIITQDRKKIINEKRKLNSLRLVLSEKCNFGCDYCFVKERQSELRCLTLPKLIKSIDRLAELNKGGFIELHYFGGEPLIKLDMINDSIDHVNQLIVSKKIKGVYYGITTNGSLITDVVAKLLKKNNFLVSISIDGAPTTHNKNRKYLNGHGTYNDVVRGLNILQRNQNDIAVLVTPTKNNLKKIAKSCEFIIEKLGVKFILINTPQPKNGDWEIDGEEFARQLIRCTEIARDSGAVINHFGTRVLESLNEKNKMIYSCSKLDKNYTGTINTDGKISPCIISWEDKEMLSEFKTGCSIDKFTAWKMEKPYQLSTCINCPALNVCGGPCPLEVYELIKAGKKLPEYLERCRFFREYLRWAVFYEE